MSRFVIAGGTKLRGVVKVGGAKNASLPIIAASLLTENCTTLNNVPSIKDVHIMTDLIRFFGVSVNYDNGIMHINPKSIKNARLNCSLAGEIRYSLNLIGSLLPRFGDVKIPLSGGCAIGTRKIDSHIIGLTALGAEISIREGCINAEARHLIGADIALEYPSVGATENTMVAACLAEGDTIIRNAAKEPEIVDLANFLNTMGANIRNAGKNIINIKGVNSLEGGAYSVMSDRINAGTFMVASAITGGQILIKGIEHDFLECVLKSVVAKLKEIGVEIIQTDEGVLVAATDHNLQPAEVITDVYPGFPTDMQPIITPLLALAKGKSKVKEIIYENRFNHIPELNKMGADIQIVDDNVAIINGVDNFTGSQVRAHDLRAGASLVLAGLSADGTTIIENISQIDRGYEDVVRDLKILGARIARIN